MQYVIATSKPSIVKEFTRTYPIVLLDNSKECYTTEIKEAVVYDEYTEAHEEAIIDDNHDFVIELDTAKKIFK